MKFSLMFFSGALEQSVADEYRRVLDVARLADQWGLEAIWLPERHLTDFGAPYPNPLLLLSALAVATNKIALRAGSVVAPLHNPLRMAEDLSVLDNLSGGRIEAAFASGWHPNDFVFNPANYADRRDITVQHAKQVSALWAGHPQGCENGVGEQVSVRPLPAPMRERLPIWLTAAGSPDTFHAAGRDGYDLLTHVLGGDLEGLDRNIALYRQGRMESGLDSRAGRVALMLHTFLGEDEKSVVEAVQGPYTSYLKSIASLGKGLAAARSHTIDLEKLEPRQLEQFARFQFERSVRGRSLIGTPASVLPTVEKMKSIGVDEIACLVDFGLPGQTVQDHLPYLIELRDMAVSSASMTLAS